MDTPQMPTSAEWHSQRRSRGVAAGEWDIGKGSATEQVEQLHLTAFGPFSTSRPVNRTCTYPSAYSITKTMASGKLRHEEHRNGRLRLIV